MSYNVNNDGNCLFYSIDIGLSQIVKEYPEAILDNDPNRLILKLEATKQFVEDNQGNDDDQADDDQADDDQADDDQADDDQADDDQAEKIDSRGGSGNNYQSNFLDLDALDFSSLSSDFGGPANKVGIVSNASSFEEPQSKLSSQWPLLGKSFNLLNEQTEEEQVASFLADLIDQKLLVSSINSIGLNNFYKNSFINSNRNLWSEKTRIKYLRIIAAEGLANTNDAASFYLEWESPYKEGKVLSNIIEAKKKIVKDGNWGGDFEFNEIQKYFNIGIIHFKNRDDSKSSPPILNSCPDLDLYDYYIMIRYVDGNHYHISGLSWNKPDVGVVVKMVFSKEEIPQFLKQICGNKPYKSSD